MAHRYRAARIERTNGRSVAAKYGVVALMALCHPGTVGDRIGSPRPALPLPARPGCGTTLPDPVEEASTPSPHAELKFNFAADT